ncbi:HK97 family phage prohead protease [Pseudonocardia halophobica]|uniref:Peptidase U35 n=1 Tax=Pseudonocardia halophobica TaxID=29401 RepID=A0A9W6L790_9PSEU|nr:HK97 family phage prohead protease [Pseudonocardia halophobica]GLL13370.1 peptidase U35 [Pseudonocardia halophobica]
MRHDIAGLPERRHIPLATARTEIRAASDASTGRFNGYAAVFDSRTAIGNPLLMGFYEEIAPGAFANTLRTADVRFLLDHNPFYVVSRVSAGTLDLSEDEHGLAVDSYLDEELSYVRDLKANLRNANVDGMSFGFRVLDDDWTTEQIETHDGHGADVEVRRIHEVELFEVSAVTWPAYAATSADLRAA